jgi:hypothetical protein
MTKERSLPKQRTASYSVHEFKASDVREAAGLTYRQLNDWDTKGALKGQRGGHAGWRKFSADEVFALAVCAEIRKLFGVPIESLGTVRSFMVRDETARYEAAQEMTKAGLHVWFLTDLKRVFVMNHEVELRSLFGLGFFQIEKPNGFVLLHLSPLLAKVERTLGSTSLPRDAARMGAPEVLASAATRQGAVRGGRMRVNKTK